MKEGEGEWLLVLGWECDGVDPERVKRGSDRGGSAECRGATEEELLDVYLHLSYEGI